MSYDSKGRAAVAMRVSRRTIWANSALAIFKLAAGIVAHSSSMISDAIHSASDVFSTITVMIGIRLASQDSDKEHEYGHERLECIAALLLAAVLALTGGGIGYSGYQKILSAAAGSLAAPGVLALGAAVVSVLCKEAMYWYTRAAAKKIDSTSLMADAWHHRSDALSSVGAFIGILGARLGYPVLDPAASLVICIFIWKVSYDIFREAVRELTDHSCAPDVEKEMRELILRQEGVARIDVLRTRQFGPRVYVDVEFSADGGLSLYDSHAIAEQVHHAVEHSFPAVKHCMVHVNPLGEDGPSE